MVGLHPVEEHQQERSEVEAEGDAVQSATRVA
jgi:hypothetical protein